MGEGDKQHNRSLASALLLLIHAGYHSMQQLLHPRGGWWIHLTLSPSQHCAILVALEDMSNIKHHNIQKFLAPLQIVPPPNPMDTVV